MIRLLTFLLVLGLLLQIAANISLEIFFHRYILHLEKQLGGKFRFEYQSVFVDLVTRSFGLNGFRLAPDRSVNGEGTLGGKTAGILEIDIPGLRIRGIDWVKYLLTRNLSVRRIVFRQARILRHRPLVPEIPPPVQQRQQQRGEKTLILPFHLDALSVKKWEFDRCSIENVFLPAGNRKPEIVAFSFAVENCHAFFKTRGNRYSRLDLDSVELAVRDVKLVLPSRMLGIEMGELVFSSPLSRIWIQGVKLVPTYGKAVFSRKKGYRSTWTRLAINRVHFSRVNCKELLERFRLIAGQMTVRGFHCELFRDRLMPLRNISRDHLFVQDALKRFGFRFNIGQCRICRGFIDYQVQNETGMNPGNLFFSEIGIVSNQLGNDPAWLQNNQDIKIAAQGRVMGKNWLKIIFNIPANDRNGQFEFQGQMQHLTVTDLNPILSQALVQAESGVINRLVFSARANKYGSRGVMKLHYNGLKISVLSKKKQGKRAMLPSFLANRIILANNPRGRKQLRIGLMNVERRTPRSVFNLIGRSFLSGIKSSIGLRGEK